MKIALISMPWQNPTVPSIQLAVLKSFVEQEVPGVTVDTHHMYLHVANLLGLPIYKAFVDTPPWISEGLFSYHLFLEEQKRIGKFLADFAAQYRPLQHLDMQDALDQIGATVRAELSKVDWTQYAVIGITVAFAQSMSSLLAASIIRDLHPEARLILGGPGVVGEVGQSLLQHFPYIEAIVHGEGERPLSEMVACLQRDPQASLAHIQGVMVRREEAAYAKQEMPLLETVPLTQIDVQQISELKELPAPDFSDYFAQVRPLELAKEVQHRISLPLEASRGCWWDRSHKNSKWACSFCNLNLQWKGYREKGWQQVVEEMRDLSDRHQVLRFEFVDNILRFRETEAFLNGIIGLNRSFAYFVEARASVKPTHWELLRRSGAMQIQIGVESLSSGMLKKINKGTTALQNIEAMKWCEEFGITSTSNVIVDYPNIPESDIEELLQNISFCTGFRPLDIATFRLMYQSPLYKHAQEHGLVNIRNADEYRWIMPKDLHRSLFMLEKSFDAPDLVRLLPRWQQVRESIAAWGDVYYRTRMQYNVRSLLLYQDGGDYLIVTDYRSGEPVTIKLEGLARRVYLYVSAAKTFRAVCDYFPEVDSAELREMLERWRQQKLAFCEQGRYVSLAIAADPLHPSRAPEFVDSLEDR